MGRSPKRHFVRLRQEIATFVLILTILQTALTNVTSSDQPVLEPVYLLKIVVYTNSDWTAVDFDGLSPFAHNASVVLGAEAPELWYSSGPGRIHIVKKQADPTPVSLETWFLATRDKDEGSVSIEKGYMGDTVVDIYYYASSWIRLASFTHSGVNTDNPSHNTRSFIVEYRQLYSSPSGYATVEPVPLALERTVLAFYYPWYLTLSGPGGVTWHTDGGYAHNPLFGRYDSADERIIEAHIMMAKAAGIDGFIAGFNGIGQNDEKPMPTIFRIADALDFSITFYECTDRPYLTSKDMIDELSHIVQTYSFHKSFLKVNGVPVIFVYAVGAGSRSLSFWLDVVNGVEANVGPVYLIGDLCLPPDPRLAEAFDGLHWYGAPDTGSASQAFDLYEKSMRLGLKDIASDQAIERILQGRSITLKEKFLAFTVEPGYDHTKEGGTEYLDRRDGQTYEEFWNTALSRNPDGILLTSWNEWHEGSEIEPSIEYGFTYLNLTRQYTSVYKGTKHPLNSPTLKIRTDLGNVVRYGIRNASFWISNGSPNVQAVYVNLSISSSEGLNLTSVDHNDFYSYVQRIYPHIYNVMIPLLKPSETLAFNTTLAASVGVGNLKITVTGYSPSGVAKTVSATSQVQVVHDRVIVDLEASQSRVQVGSEALITKGAYYEYDHQPLSGIVYLNDTLTKSSVGACCYTVSSISDNLYGLTDFTSDTVSIIFDRIIMNPATETTIPGSISVSVKLSFESDGQPADRARVTVNGILAAETSPGNFQTTVATWSPLYQINITMERPGFLPQNITLSGYATGNIAVEAVAAAILVVVLNMLIRRRGL